MADIVFVVDSSGSIRDANPNDGSYDNWELLLNFMVTMVDKLNIGSNQVRIGVVKFSTDAESVFHLNRYTDKNSLKEAIRRISYLGGHTNTAGGIRIMNDVEFTSQNGDRPGIPNIAIVVTDDVSTRDKASTIPEAIRARNDGIKIYSVGITSGVKEAELRDISSSPHEKDKNYFMAPNFQNLDRVAVAITSDVCDNDVNECAVRNGGCEQTCVNTDSSFQCRCHSGFTLSDNKLSCEGKSHTIHVNECAVRNGGCEQTCVNTDGSFQCSCRGGFTLSDNKLSCEGACENYKADIVFVVDSSGSIRDANPRDRSYDNWELLLNFMVTMVDKLNIGLNQVRIGVVMFSTDAESVFYMNQYTDKNSLKAAIRGISYLGGHTNTAGGIRIMHDVEFTPQNGDRPGVPNIAIVVTDGVSTRDALSTIPEAIRARNDGIKIYSVGITSAVKEAELRDISSSPHEKDKNYFMAPNFQNLDRVAVAITSDACDNDVNECAVRNGGCEQTCVNTDGSFQCRCHSGFTLSDNKLSCEGKSHTIHVNECAVRNGGCEQTCVNTGGSFKCSCRGGFTLSDNKLSCEDVNECAVRNGGCEQTCVNTDGSFQCSCRGGFTLSDNKLSCEGKSHNIRISGISGIPERGGWGGASLITHVAAQQSLAKRA
ncbi:hypothetical protein LSAT2_001785 [Lamellibrachia satsuma]|nr:hypothetical protein LSAT2_001785 [Lamellibrachia satsuma]